MMEQGQVHQLTMIDFSKLLLSYSLLLVCACDFVLQSNTRMQLGKTLSAGTPMLLAVPRTGWYLSANFL